jgi:hypothetical protein
MSNRFFKKGASGGKCGKMNIKFDRRMPVIPAGIKHPVSSATPNTYQMPSW